MKLFKLINNLNNYNFKFLITYKIKYFEPKLLFYNIFTFIYII